MEGNQLVYRQKAKLKDNPYFTQDCASDIENVYLKTNSSSGMLISQPFMEAQNLCRPRTQRLDPSSAQQTARALQELPALLTLPRTHAATTNGSTASLTIYADPTVPHH